MAVLVANHLTLRLRRSEEPDERPPDLLQGARLDAVLRDPSRRRCDHRRRAAHVPEVRQHARGASDSAHPVGRRRDGVARPGPADRRRDGARCEIPRPTALARLGALRRQRDGGGLDVGGLRARGALRARQPHRDHRREPARSARRDDDRLEHGRVRRARAGVRLERDRGRRARRRGDRPRLQGSGRDKRTPHGDRGPHDQGQGRQGGRGQGRLARQGARRPGRGDRGARRRPQHPCRRREAGGRRATPVRGGAARAARATSSARRWRRGRRTARRSQRSGPRVATWSLSTAR